MNGFLIEGNILSESVHMMAPGVQQPQPDKQNRVDKQNITARVEGWSSVATRTASRGHPMELTEARQWSSAPGTPKMGWSTSES